MTEPAFAIPLVRVIMAIAEIVAFLLVLLAGLAFVLSLREDDDEDHP